MEALLGPSLLRRSGGSTSTSSALRDARFVLVYCSASWCGPCRQFTPALSSFFGAAGPRLRAAAVLVSCDRDDAAFRSYWQHMPASFFALAPDDAAGQALMHRFGVRGIPALLVFVAATGTLVTATGVEGLSRDPAGAAFPWVAGGADIARRVALRGLAARPELNGCRGVVEAVVAAPGRLQVALDAPREVVAVKREHVEFNKEED